jgi:hypothetical protein
VADFSPHITSITNDEGTPYPLSLSSMQTQKSTVSSCKHAGGASYRAAKAVGGFVLCHQSAIPMRRVAWMARSKLTILSGSSKASWTADGKYLFSA